MKSQKTKLPDNLRLLFARPDFQAEVKAFRIKMGLGLNGLQSLEMFDVWIKHEKHTEDRQSVFDLVKTIMSTFDIRVHPYFILIYLVCDLYALNIIYKDQIKIEPATNGIGSPVISITILPTTRLDDLKKEWHRVVKIQKKISAKANNKTSENTERDIRLLELKGQKKSNKEIFAVINREFPTHKFSEISSVSQRLSRIMKRTSTTT